MDPLNNQNSPTRRKSNTQNSPRGHNSSFQDSPHRQNFSNNFTDPPPYYPQNLQNPQIPPPNFFPNFPHHSPQYPNYGPHSVYGSPQTYHNYMVPPPNFFPGSHSPNYGSPVERNSSGRESRNDHVDDVEDDIEVGGEAVQNDEEPANRRQWRTKEDEALISCYLQFSVDPIVGTNQSLPVLWGKIHRAYTTIQQHNRSSMHVRNMESLRGRWRRLSYGISQWVGCYEQANRRRSSGMSEDDVVAEAMSIYTSDHKKKNFMFMHQWLKLKDQPRWESFCPQLSQPTNNHSESGDTNSSGKRTRFGDDLNLNMEDLCTGFDEDESVPETAQQGPSQSSRASVRPQGRQAAKRSKGKNKMVYDSVDSIIEVEKNKTMEKISEDKKEIAYLETFNSLVNLQRELTPLEKISFQVICKKLGFDSSNI